MVVGVLVELSAKAVDKVFDYNVPCELEKDIKVGIRVLVPFGRMTLEGFVLEIKNSTSTDRELKEIIDVVDKDIVLNNELLELGKVMRDNTLSTLISCYQVMLPKALKAGRCGNIKYDTYYKLDGDYSNIKLNDKQKEIIELVKNGPVIRKSLADISLSSLNTLIKKGVLVEERKEHYRVDYKEEKNDKFKLTNDQQKVVDDVISDTNTYLLYGVTGSGKTEVYMEIIEKE